MTAPTFTRNGSPFTPIDTAILKLARGGTLPAVGTLLRNGTSFPMIDTRPLRWHQGAGGGGGGGGGVTVTWDPANTSSALTLSGGNLHIVHTGGNGDTQSRATLGRTDTSGKFYFEQKLDDRWTEIGIAMGTASTPLDGALYAGGTTEVVCLGNGYFGYNGTQLGSPAGLATGDYVGMLWDAATDIYTIYKNGTVLIATASACPMTGAKFPMHTSYGTNDASTVNFGATPFSFQPAGSTSWDGSRTA